MSDTVDPTTVDESPARRLVRVHEGRWLGGVAAGLGRYFDINPLVYRIAFAALALVGGTGVLLYLAAWLVIPGEEDDDSIAVEALRGRRDQPWLLVGVGLLSFGALFALSEARFWPGTGNLWLAATLVGGALVWWHMSQRGDRSGAAPVEAELAEEADAPAAPDGATTRIQPPRPAKAPRPPARPSLFAPVLGALLAAAGLFGLLAVLDVYEVDVAAALAACVVIVGAAIAFGALTQRRVGGLVVLGLLLLAWFSVAATMPVSIDAGVGEKHEQPLSAASLERSYELGVGELDLDLSGVALEAGTTRVDTSVGIGKIVVTVPPDVALRVDAHAGVGSIDLLGARDDGIDADREIDVPGASPDAPVLDLEADIAVGDIQVLRG
jgi:phage shock protein PspC (stress-responsive transcriptional regulator)